MRPLPNPDPPSSGSRAHRRSARVDALRGLAALSVVVYHVFLQARLHGVTSVGLGRLDDVVFGNIDRLGGWGVSVFLVLSGWGMVRSLEHSGLSRSFVSRRVARLYPMFWWVALPTIALAAVFGSLHVSELWKLPFWLMGLNFVSPRLFTPLPGVAPQWWYVGLALQVYLVFPLAWLILRRAGLAALVGCALLVNGASLVVVAQLPPAWHYLDMGFVGARLMEVVAGVFLYLTLSSPLASKGARRAAPLWTGLFAAFVVLALIQPSERLHWVLEISVVALVALVLWAPAPSGLRSHFSRGIADWMGQVSYPLYLCHYGVIALVLAGLQGVDSLSLPLLLALGITASVLAAVGFHYSLPWVWPLRGLRPGGTARRPR